MAIATLIPKNINLFITSSVAAPAAVSLGRTGERLNALAWIAPMRGHRLIAP
jgi:hypothetical protein